MATIWILMRGGAKTGGLLCGIAKTETEKEMWVEAGRNTWAVEVDTETDGIFAEPMNGTDDDAAQS